MQRFEHQVLAFVGTWVPGNDLATAADHHLMHVTADPDLLVA